MKYQLMIHTQNYTKYLGSLTIDNLQTALIFIETNLKHGYNVDIKVIL